MFAIDKFKYKVLEEEDNYGKYEFGPFPNGYGTTIGNALRRLLLSSIEGAAVTSVRVKGVKHEYSTISGVSDDVLTILLKIKQLALQSHSDEIQTIKLSAKGEGEVKAEDIELTSDVELANPQLVITEITESGTELEIEMDVEKGKGYHKGDEDKRKQAGNIPLDANYSPVKKVVFNVSSTRVGQQTDLDKIELEVYTNKAVEPRDALTQACEIYAAVTARLFRIVTGEEYEEEISEEPKEEEEEEKAEEMEEKESSSDLDIEKINLSARLTNSLLKAGIDNLTELEGKGKEEIMEIPGLGEKSAEELIDIMKSYKLDVKTE